MKFIKQRVLLVALAACLLPGLCRAQSSDSKITFIKLSERVGYIIDPSENTQCECITFVKPKDFRYAALAQINNNLVVLRIKLGNNDSYRSVPLTETELIQLHSSAMAMDSGTAVIDAKMEEQLLKEMAGNTGDYQLIDYDEFTYPVLPKDKPLDMSPTRPEYSMTDANPGTGVSRPGRPYHFRSMYKNAGELSASTRGLSTKPYLKAHLKNGDICILKDSWKVDTTANMITAQGIRYGLNRDTISNGSISINIDSVAIFETNTKLEGVDSGRITALSILTAVDVIIGIICLTNPKACFGSCPTFYINENDNFHYADAEGFTNAISPSMEYFDIDALNNPKTLDGKFSITMRNEALETHCVNSVKLLAFPRKEGERVYQSPENTFYLCENSYPPIRAIGPEGDIKTSVSCGDKEPRFSAANETNLNSKEELFIDFESIKNPDQTGLVLDFRQTLMTTYLFYSVLGYMGDNAGKYFASMENHEEKRRNFDNTSRILGGIEVFLWNEKNKMWEFQAKVTETGPIAFNHQILPLNNVVPGSDIKLKLVLNKGLWQIDCLSLANIREKITPVEINPTEILNKSKIDHVALNQINADDQYLISMPGSEYKFNFILPDQYQDFELFLYSKGYYLEWMRNHWLKDKNLLKMNQLVNNPAKFLRTEARDYKRYETDMTQIFWDSKIDVKTFSYHEN